MDWVIGLITKIVIFIVFCVGFSVLFSWITGISFFSSLIGLLSILFLSLVLPLIGDVIVINR